MQPRWSSIWLLLIRVPLWQRNFPLLRQFALFIELQRANRHPDTLRGSFCSGWKAEGITALGGQIGLDGYAPGRAEILEWEWWEVRDPKVNWKLVISLTCDQLVEKIQIPARGLCNFFSRLCFWPFCQIELKLGLICTFNHSNVLHGTVMYRNRVTEQESILSYCVLN